ncbi:hypothetical protein WJX84_009853 [Apatococcus fuscideae]|uniref:F-box domain-containing protein n=1 Tax=Apatococcus fuscideae TaxID=2026836 RepID=A0AAW1SWI2_9CHLO
MSFAGRPLEQLTDVFREYLLQHLPASSLARLRASCQSFCCLVDNASGVVWRTAARSVLPSEAVPQAAPGKAVQTCLRQQGLTLAAISSGARQRPPLGALLCRFLTLRSQDLVPRQLAGIAGA